ncbi:ComF family protein [Runella slithyformis]|uniref:Phosphoribosyltransferase n=1 Tax=Runella slithyformis (strain ATCC 29530 / DSM 19594 / LMG 11500 / NCIMB 11436 / LSU 4) TaxID=761193 RepID=A0A7U3ZNI3_RUNSL|nr:ComF family protein [Runella slithyformis]AEI50476.1 phosphoribosyltransferase [Runella slithyformis DSM 19594]
MFSPFKWTLIWRDVLDLFYPNLCSLCGVQLVGNEEVICTKCRTNLPRTQSHQRVIPALDEKFAGKVLVRNVYAFLKFEKGGGVQRMLHQLKYENRPEVGNVLGQLYGFELMQAGVNHSFDWVIPIPLHSRKLAQRGYNQSDQFAAGLSEGLGVPWSDEILKRERFTATQTRKSRIERFENVSGIFQVVQPDKIIGQRIALVDDIVTTGSTLESAITELLQNGAKEVSVITIAAAY